MPSNNHSTIKIIGILAPFIIAVMIFFFRIETRLTRIETDITWIKQTQYQCQHNLEKGTN
ncbi:hypothetical protein ES702_05029 [subsurface metagenome]